VRRKRRRHIVKKNKIGEKREKGHVCQESHVKLVKDRGGHIFTSERNRDKKLQQDRKEKVNREGLASLLQGK